MDDEQKIRNELFGKYREDVLRRQLSNTENYDKAVLSLGTTFLGFSLGFLKDFVIYKNAIVAWLLPMSWVLFCISIVATIASFFVSQKGLSTQLEYAEKYYLENDSSYLTKKNHAAALTDIANLGSAVSFVFAVITTIVFVIFNLENGVNMSQKRIHGIALDGASVPSLQLFTKGASIPTMQQFPSGLSVAAAGAQIPTMQLAPAPVTTQPAPSSQSGSVAQNSGNNNKGGAE